MTVEAKDLAEAEIEFLSDKCERLETQLNIAVEALKDSRYLFYQLSQIVAGDGITECLKEIRELDK
jgi:hypothetical protein